MRTLLVAFAGILIGLTVGWAAVHLVVDQPGQAPRRVEVDGDPQWLADGDAGDPCSELARQLGALRAELALAERLLADLSAELEGVPPTWPDAQVDHEQAAFQAVMAEVAVRCPDVRVVNVDCSEPPCQAWLAHTIDPRTVKAKHASDRLVNCSAWVGAYGERVDESSFRVCSGTGEWGSVVGARTTDAVQLDPTGDPSAVIDNLRRRTTTRADRAREEWPCVQP